MSDEQKKSGFFGKVGHAFKNFFVGIGKWFTDKFDSLKAGYGRYKLLTPKEKGRWWGNGIFNNAIYILFIGFALFVWIYMLITSNGRSNFFSLASIINIIKQTSYYAFLALGVGGVIVLTGTDLSAGRILGLVACICASLMQETGLSNKMWPNLAPPPIIVVFLIAITVGALVGLVNGFFTAQFKMHPFIATLGSQLIVYGIALIYVNLGNNGGVSISGLTQNYTDVAAGPLFTIGGQVVPKYVLYALLAWIVTWFIWNKTKLGKNMYAVGANPEAANVSGVSVYWTTVIMFIIAGVMYGVSGFIDAARVGSNLPTTGQGAEMYAIAACVIGGVSFTGGVGKVSGIMLGVLLLQLVNIGLSWLKVDPGMLNIITGFIVLFAVAIDMRKYIAKK